VISQNYISGSSIHGIFSVMAAYATYAAMTLKAPITTCMLETEM